MPIDREQFTIILQCLIIVMIGVTWAFVMYTIIQNNNTNIQNQQLATKSGFAIVRQINDKLDAIHEANNKLVAAQGNISSHQRNQIIEEFTNATAQGGFSTKQQSQQNKHILEEILANITVNKTK